MTDTSKPGQLTTEGQLSLPYLLGTISSWLVGLGRQGKAAVPSHQNLLGRGVGCVCDTISTHNCIRVKSPCTKRAVSSLINKWRKSSGSQHEPSCSPCYREDTGWAPHPNCQCPSVLDSLHSDFSYSAPYSLGLLWLSLLWLFPTFHFITSDTPFYPIHTHFGFYF